MCIFAQLGVPVGDLLLGKRCIVWLSMEIQSSSAIGAAEVGSTVVDVACLVNAKRKCAAIGFRHGCSGIGTERENADLPGFRLRQKDPVPIYVSGAARPKVIRSRIGAPTVFLIWRLINTLRSEQSLKKHIHEMWSKNSDDGVESEQPCDKARSMSGCSDREY